MLAVLLMTKGQWKECAAVVLATTTSNGKHHAAYMKMTYLTPSVFDVCKWLYRRSNVDCS